MKNPLRQRELRQAQGLNASSLATVAVARGALRIASDDSRVPLSTTRDHPPHPPETRGAPGEGAMTLRSSGHFFRDRHNG
jgi:hypothetical protein